MQWRWSHALAASVAIGPAAASAAERRVDVAVAPGTLADALSALAAQAGLSFGFDGPIPAIRVAGVRGRMTPRAALDALLRGTSIVARQVAPTVYRLGPRQTVAVPRRRPDPPAPDILVTARKQPEALSHVPAPLAVLLGNSADAPSTARDVAHAITNLVVAGRGPGADKLFLRGLADSPFNGFSQSTVSVQVDDGRITYDAAEPGLSLVDMARVEVLKGPQGPLYGTGALGGVYRLVTNRPLLDRAGGSASVSAGAIAGGGPTADVEGTANLPLITGRAALRIVGYASSTAGWIDDRPGPANANAAGLYGGRVALRIVPGRDWTVDLTGGFQHLAARDSRYLFQDGEDLARPSAALEPRATGFALAQGRIEGPVGGLRLIVATSQAWQNHRDLYDLSAVPDLLGVAGASSYLDRRVYRVFDQELRIAPWVANGATWTLGLSYLSATTQATGDVNRRAGPALRYFTLQRQATEAAFYAEGNVSIVPRVSIGAGFRLFRSSVGDERDEGTQPVFSAKTLLGFTPSMSLSYDLGARSMVYARVASAFRPGGIDAGNAATGRYQADETRNIDLGARLAIGTHMSLDAGLYAARWNDVQSDYLEPTGLFATRNAGRAEVIGADVALSWRPDPATEAALGVTAQHARLTRTQDGSDLPSDRRLPLTPDLAMDVSLARRIVVSGMTLRPFAALTYKGDRRLSFDDGLDRRMAPYFAARAGATMATGPLTVRLEVDNLLDTRADTFSYGNPFTVRSLPQFTPLQPRTVTLSVARRFD